MNKPIDYSKYKISFTSDFDKVWLQLKNARDDKSKETVDKVYDIIDALLSGEDVEDLYGAHHPSKDTDVWDIHIEPQGRTTGDLVLLYRITSMSIELDLRLQNIVDHQDLYKKSATNYADRQKLYNFDVVIDKYSEDQIEYSRQCYDYIISDYKLFQCTGDTRKQFAFDRINKYINSINPICDILTYDDLITIIYYIENTRKKKIFGAIQFDSDAKETGKITEQEETDILTIFDNSGVFVVDAYVDTITDEYGDTYEDMYVVAEIRDQQLLARLNSELRKFSYMTDIQFSASPNGYGNWGHTYDFYHYFEE